MSAADHAVRLERRILGTALDDTAEGAPAVLGTMRPEDYIAPHHGRLHRALAALHAAGRLSAGVDALAAHLHATGASDAVGGLVYIAELMTERLPSVMAVEAIAAEHARYAGRARLQEVARAVAELASGRSVLLWGKSYDPPDDPRMLVRLSTQLHEQAVRGGPSGERSQFTAGESLVAMRLAAEQRHAEGVASAISTGIPILDDNLRGRGFKPGQLVIVAGRPGTGKTAAVLGFAISAALAGRRVAFFSLEMEHAELTVRGLSWLTGIDGDTVELATTGADPDMLPLMTQEQWDDLLEAEQVWSDLPIRIDDRPGQSLAEMAATCEAWRAADGSVDLVVIDYLQLVSHEKGERHDISVGNTSKRLKELAKRLKCPVLCLSQFNRGPEGRTAGAATWVDEQGRPRPSDLKDSGAIEQDADIILAPMHAKPSQMPHMATAGDAAMLILKQRGGATGDVPVRWDGPATRYFDSPMVDEML